MRWLKHLVCKWVREDWDNARSFSQEIEPVKGRGNGTLGGTVRVSSTYDDENVIRFTLYGATGGKIVEAMSYDKKNDRERIHRYVVSEEGNLSDTLAKIVTMESLR